MGVLDDIKKSFEDSDSSDDSTFGQTGSSEGFDSGSDDSQFGSSGGFDDSGGLNSQQGSGLQDGQGMNNQPGRSPQQQGSDQLSGGQRNNGSPGNGSPAGNRPGDQPGTQRADSGGTPNAQAGRPKEGGSSPQLSQDTRRKMENAGLSGRNERSSESQQDVNDDIEELKRQNQQIIDLLEDIVDEMRGGRRR